MEKNTKSNFSILGKSVSVYSRKEEDDTMIIRDSSSQEPYNAFGISGLDNIKEMFHGIITLLHAKRCLFQTLKFDVGNQLKEFIDGIDSTNTIEDFKGRKVVYLGGKWRIDLIIRDYPQIALANLENGKAVTGIYLFPSVIIKLLRYTNNRFHYYEDKVVVHKDCKNDDFF